MSDPVVIEITENDIGVIEVEPEVVTVVEVPEAVTVVEVLVPGPMGPVGNIPVSSTPPPDPDINDLWVPIP